MDRRARSQQISIINTQENGHFTGMGLMNLSATSRALIQKIGLFARQQVSAQIVKTTTFATTRTVS